MSHSRSVLLVEADPDERSRLAAWLEESGRDVMTCPGPTDPDFTCIGSRTHACPLASDASTIVLDMATHSEALMRGVPSEALLAFYLVSGRPIVALGSHRASDVLGQLVRLHRHPARSELLDALAFLEDPTRQSGGRTDNELSGLAV